MVDVVDHIQVCGWLMLLITSGLWVVDVVDHIQVCGWWMLLITSLKGFAFY